VAERFLTPWRGAWLRAVARGLKAWAEAVLAEEAASAPAVTPVGAPRPESHDSTPADTRGIPSVGAPPESLEARWLRDMEARRRIPLADWVARVSRAAPHLLEELARPGPGAARRTPASARTASKDFRSMARPAPAVDSPEAGDEVSAAAARPEPPSLPEAVRRRAPAPPPSPASAAATPVTTHPEPEAAWSGQATSWGLGPELFAAFQARSAPTPRPVRAEPHPPPAPPAPTSHEPHRQEASTSAARRSPWDDLPPFASEPSARAPTLVPRLVPPLSDAEPFASTRRVEDLPTADVPRVRAFPRDGDAVPPREPPRDRVGFAADDDHWDGAQSPLVWRPRQPEFPPSAPPLLLTLEDEPRLIEGTSGSSTPSPWPELPPAPRAERMEGVVELREWERLRRLDREQRGE
jgi:hypothetical protein